MAFNSVNDSLSGGVSDPELSGFLSAEDLSRYLFEVETLISSQRLYFATDLLQLGPFRSISDRFRRVLPDVLSSPRRGELFPRLLDLYAYFVDRAAFQPFRDLSTLAPTGSLFRRAVVDAPFHGVLVRMLSREFFYRSVGHVVFPDRGVGDALSAAARHFHRGDRLSFSDVQDWDLFGDVMDFSRVHGDALYFVCGLDDEGAVFRGSWRHRSRVVSSLSTKGFRVRAVRIGSSPVSPASIVHILSWSPIGVLLFGGCTPVRYYRARGSYVFLYEMAPAVWEDDFRWDLFALQWLFGGVVDAFSFLYRKDAFRRMRVYSTYDLYFR